MKIAIVVSSIDIRGGTHKQVLRLCQFLEKENIQFVLCAKEIDLANTYPEFSTYDIIRLNKEIQERKPSGFNLIKKLNNLRAEIEEQEMLYSLIPADVDIFNIHDNNLEYLIWKATNHGKKVVWQINDLNWVFRVGAAKNTKDTVSKKIKRKIIRYIAKKTDVITVNVSKNKERVEKHLNKKARVFYCGVDRNDSLKKHAFNTGNKPFHLLTMGVFFAYRNYEVLVDAIKELRVNGIDVQLDIIGSIHGDIDYYQTIKKRIKDSGIDDYVHIWGQVDELRYNELFNQADAFAFLNIDQSWGLAVFEAMSCGLPTIVSNSVGAVELLNNDVDSIIVNPKDVSEICDVVKRLMSNPIYYESISSNAMRAVTSYTWDELYCSKMLGVFQELEK